MNTGILPIFFSRGRGPGGVLIRAGIGSPWAHCGILHGSLALEATVPRVATPPARELLAQLRRAHPGRPLHELAAIGWVEMPAPRGALNFAYGQAGKGYDWAGALGVGFRRDWQRPDLWFCSELVAAACAHGGKPLFHADAGRVSPWDLWVCGQVVRGPELVDEEMFSGDWIVSHWAASASAGRGG